MFHTQYNIQKKIYIMENIKEKITRAASGGCVSSPHHSEVVGIGLALDIVWVHHCQLVIVGCHPSIHCWPSECCPNHRVSSIQPSTVDCRASEHQASSI